MARQDSAPERMIILPSVKEGRPIEALEDITASLSALNTLLSTYHEQGDSPSETTTLGIYCLLQQQCEALVGVQHALLENEASKGQGSRAVPDEALNDAARKLRYDMIETNAKAGVDPDLIAAAMNIGTDNIERVVGRLRGAEAPAGRAGRTARAEAR